jgi:hypothetical protein
MFKSYEQKRKIICQLPLIHEGGNWGLKQTGGKMGLKVSMAILVGFFLHFSLQGALQLQAKNNKTWLKFKNDFLTPGLKVVWDKSTSVPRIIMGTKVPPPVNLRQKIDEKTIPLIIYDFVKKYEGLLRSRKENFKIKSIKQFQNKWYVKAQTYYKGIPIFRGHMGFVLDQKGNILSYGSDCNPSMTVETSPVISQTEAEQIAQYYHKDSTDLPVIIKEIYLTIYQQIMPLKPVKYRLAWYIYLGGDTGHFQMNRVFIIDAITGEKIKDFYPYHSGQLLAACYDSITNR